MELMKKEIRYYMELDGLLQKEEIGNPHFEAAEPINNDVRIDDAIPEENLLVEESIPDLFIEIH